MSRKADKEAEQEVAEKQSIYPQKQFICVQPTKSDRSVFLMFTLSYFSSEQACADVSVFLRVSFIQFILFNIMWFMTSFHFCAVELYIPFNLILVKHSAAYIVRDKLIIDAFK